MNPSPCSCLGDQNGLCHCTAEQLGPAGIKAHCAIGTPDRKLLEHANQRLALYPRACLRILKVARTLADLEAKPNIGTAHLAEEVSYRNGEAGRSPM